MRRSQTCHSIKGINAPLSQGLNGSTQHTKVCTVTVRFPLTCRPGGGGQTRAGLFSRHGHRRCGELGWQRRDRVATLPLRKLAASGRTQPQHGRHHHRQQRQRRRHPQWRAASPTRERNHRHPGQRLRLQSTAALQWRNTNTSLLPYCERACYLILLQLSRLLTPEESSRKLFGFLRKKPV